jgi:flavin-dependent dehydrogenase
VKTFSYWIDTAPEGADYTRTTLPDRVDVSVIGGGLTGMSAAIHIRAKGASVALVEAEKLGWGCVGPQRWDVDARDHNQLPDGDRPVRRRRSELNVPGLRRRDKHC